VQCIRSSAKTFRLTPGIAIYSLIVPIKNVSHTSSDSSFYDRLHNRNDGQSRLTRAPSLSLEASALLVNSTQCLLCSNRLPNFISLIPDPCRPRQPGARTHRGPRPSIFDCTHATSSGCDSFRKPFDALFAQPGHNLGRAGGL
jgi:hypothetical protein